MTQRGRHRLYFAMVEVVTTDMPHLLSITAAGAFVHVAGRAADERDFRRIVSEGAAALGVILVDVEWVAPAARLTQEQRSSSYYDQLIEQSAIDALAWGEFQCYPKDDRRGG